MDLLDPIDLDAGQTLAAVQGRVRSRRRAEVEDLLLVLHWADLHASCPRAEAAVQGRRLPAGGDRLVQLGGAGTPGVRELAVLELGIAREVHPLSARAVVADALDLRHRLPLTWAVIGQLEGEPWLARKVARLSRRLDADQVAVVDRTVGEVIGSLSPGRVLTVVEATVMQVDSERVRAEREEAARRRHVTLGRSDEQGLRTIIARVTAGDAAWVDATLTRVADILAATEHANDTSAGRDELRAEALGWLARPADLLRLLLEHQASPATDEPTESDQPDQPDQPEQPGEPSRATAFPADLLGRLTPSALKSARPKAVLYLHLHETAVLTGTGVARVEGLGPVLPADLCQLLARTDLVVTPVIDLAEERAVDSYEYPPPVAERLHLLKPADQFPHATTRTRQVDLDHTTPYTGCGPPGQTSSHTGQPLTRTPHRAKTHLGYDAKAISPTETVWRTPNGLGYLVDHTGTHPLPTNDPALSGL